MTLDRLWICDQCELIGSEAQARAHHATTKHLLDEVSQQVSDGVREEWARASARRTVGFMQARKVLRL